MIVSKIEKAVMLGALALALAVGCNESDAPAAKTAKAEKPAAEPAKAQPKEKAPGGGGSDEVADAEPPEPDAEPEDEFAGYDPRVVKAAQVAREIATAPETADDVLAKQDLDRDKLDALMYEIASDPDLTEQYRIARGL